MRKFIAALALISLIAIPSLTQTANAADVSRPALHSGATATKNFASKRAFPLALQLTGRPACAREAAACDRSRRGRKMGNSDHETAVADRSRWLQRVSAAQILIL